MIIPKYRPPYDDELSYSWILSLGIANGFEGERSPSKSFVKAFWGESEEEKNKQITTTQRFDYLRNLQSIIPNIQTDLACPDIRTIMMRNTPFAVLSIARAYGNSVEIAKYAVDEEKKDVLAIKKQKSDLGELCACPLCVKEDKHKFGEGYYHVDQNVPGVRVCWKHHVPLLKLKRTRKVWEPKSLDEFLEIAKETVVNNKELDIKFAEFVHAQYCQPIFISKKEVAQMIRRKMQVDNRNLQNKVNIIAAEMKRNGYGCFFSGDLSTHLRRVATETNSPYQEVVATLIFLFENYTGFYHETYDFAIANEKKIKARLTGSLKLKSDFGMLIELECKKCGTSFWTHAYEGMLGGGCPECDAIKRPEEIISRQLRSDLKEGYSLVGQFKGYYEDTEIRHNLCGRIIKISPKERIWNQKECRCKIITKFEDYQQQVADKSNQELELLRLSEGIGTNKTATFIHNGPDGCGRMFTTNLQCVLSNPRCRNCQASKMLPGTGTIHLVEKIRQYVGNEYSLTRYSAQSNKMTVMHHLCGTETEMLTNSFFQGTRCKLCSGLIRYKWIEKQVNECTGGMYHVVERNKNNHEVVIKLPDGSRRSVDPAFAVQELQRP